VRPMAMTSPTLFMRVVSVSLNIQGTSLGRDLLSQVGGELGAVDGVDYVHLGFKPGGSQVILGMGESIAQVYPTAADGRPIADLPVMEGVKTYDDVSLLIDFAAGNLPFAWIAFAGERYNQKIAAGITAVMATDLYPYLQSGQLVGVINGLKGAAEYAALLDEHYEEELTWKYPPMRAMNAISIAHVLIVALIILGNYQYFTRHRRRREQS